MMIYMDRDRQYQILLSQLCTMNFSYKTLLFNTSFQKSHCPVPPSLMILTLLNICHKFYFCVENAHEGEKETNIWQLKLK